MYENFMIGLNRVCKDDCFAGKDMKLNSFKDLYKDFVTFLTLNPKETSFHKIYKADSSNITTEEFDIKALEYVQIIVATNEQFEDAINLEKKKKQVQASKLSTQGEKIRNAALNTISNNNKTKKISITENNFVKLKSNNDPEEPIENSFKTKHNNNSNNSTKTV
jgi:hypothetical protein